MRYILQPTFYFDGAPGYINPTQEYRGSMWYDSDTKEFIFQDGVPYNNKRVIYSMRFHEGHVEFVFQPNEHDIRDMKYRLEDESLKDQEDWLRIYKSKACKGWEDLA